MKNENKIFEPDEFVSVALPLINDGLAVPLRVSGGSMEPYLAGGRDTVYITKPTFPLKKGDIAFFSRSAGKIVMHRIYRVKANEYFFIGDGQTVIEGPIFESQIFGVVKDVHRKGKNEKRNSFTPWFFRHIWINLIPLRPFLLKVYRCTLGKIKKKKRL